MTLYFFQTPTVTARTTMPMTMAAPTTTTAMEAPPTLLLVERSERRHETFCEQEHKVGEGMAWMYAVWQMTKLV
jgi:hypothetical protein